MPFGKKYFPDLRFTGTQAPEHGNIFFLVDDQHRQGADHIECRDDQDHGQDKEDGPFFRFHHPVKGSLLLVTVFNFKSAARGLRYSAITASWLAASGFSPISSEVISFSYSSSSLARLIGTIT